MKATKAQINTFKFVITEAVRIQKDLSHYIKEKQIKNFFEKEYNSRWGSIGMMIESPNVPTKEYINDPRRQIHLSFKSKDALIEMTQKIIKVHKLEMLITLPELYNEIKNSFYNHIVINKLCLDEKGCSTIIETALNIANNSMHSEDFYFPLVAHGLGDRRIDIGLAEIIPRNAIFNEMENIFNSVIIDKASKFCDSHTYTYEHFLKIKISKRSHERRKSLAQQMANFTIGILQIFSEHYKIAPDFLALSLNPYPNYEGFFLTKIDGKDFNYNFSSRGRIYNSELFWDNFLSEFTGSLKQVISIIIDRAISPSSEPTISERLVDSIFMFRSAMQDPDEASRIVKLTSSLERLVNTQKGNVSLRFRERVATLINVYYGEFHTWKSIAKEMYQYRSSIVHGSWSEYRNIEPIHIDKFSQLTSKAILSACFEFFHFGLNRADEPISIDYLFDELFKSIAD